MEPRVELPLLFGFDHPPFLSSSFVHVNNTRKFGHYMELVRVLKRTLYALLNQASPKSINLGLQVTTSHKITSILSQQIRQFSNVSKENMSMELIAKHRESAEVYHGVDICKKNFWDLMGSVNLPKGLVPLDADVTEFGYNKSTGFMWILRKNKKEHIFTGLSGKVYYDTEVTAFLEERKMKQVNGVKSKEMFITFTIREIYITDPISGKITFGTAAGITKAQPRAPFEL